MSAAVAHTSVPPEVGAQRRARPASSRWRAWRRHFAENGERQAHFDAAIPWSTAVELTAEQQAVWRHSLRRMRESESRHATHLLAEAARSGDPGQLECAAAVVTEEETHVRLLDRLVDRFGAGAGPDGLRPGAAGGPAPAGGGLPGGPGDLAATQAAQGLALVYYGALAEAAPDEALQAAAIRILADEEMHVLFHAERVRESLRRWSPARRARLHTAWRAAQVRASCEIWREHRRALAEAGLRPGVAVARVWHTIASLRREAPVSPDRTGSLDAFRCTC